MKTVDSAIQRACDDVRDRVALVRTRPIGLVQARRRSRQITAAAAATIALVIAVVGGIVLTRPSGDDVTSTADLPSVTLGASHMWPATPMNGSPIDVARAFAEVALGWEGAVLTEEASEPGDGPRFRVEHPYASEPLLVSLLGNWVYEVSPISLTTSEPGLESVNIPLSFTAGGDIDGIQVDAPVVAGSVGAELSVGLAGGDQIVVWVDLRSNTLDWVKIDVPGVNRPEDVVAILVRYVEDGRVISAAGGFFGGG